MGGGFTPMFEPHPHVWVIGGTGTGKTKYLKQLVLQDIEKGIGWTVYDPHGPFAEWASRYADLVFSADSGVSYNALDKRNIEKSVHDANDAFRVLFGVMFGDRSEEVFRNALFSTSHLRHWNFITVKRFLQNDSYRKKVLWDCPLPEYVDYFKQYDKPGAEKERLTVFAPLLNKLGKFLSPSKRHLTEKSTFDMRWVMNNNKRLVVNLDMRKFGRDQAKVWGNLFISSQFSQLADRRIHNWHHIFIDEFPMFSADWAFLFAQARGFGGKYIIGVQDISQMKTIEPETVASCCADKVVFRCGRASAEFMSEQFGGDKDGGGDAPRASSIQSLNNLHYFRQTLILKNGEWGPNNALKSYGPWKVPL